jgi:hypothetical protein
MTKSPAIQQVVDAIQGKPEAIKELAAALATRDVGQIHKAIGKTTGIELDETEVRTFLSSVPADGDQALAYCT